MLGVPSTVSTIDRSRRSLFQEETEQPKLKKELTLQGLSFADSKASIGDHINLRNIMELKEAFDQADTDGTGKLEFDEFVAAFGKVLSETMNQKKLQQLFMKIDANSDGGVEWDEFMNYILMENQTLDRMKELDFDYEKHTEEDPTYTTHDCHEDMIAKVMIIKPKGLSKSEGKVKTASKFVTAGKDGNVKFFNMKGTFESEIEASVSYILSLAFLPECSTLVVSTETKELLFYEITPMALQPATLIGKFSPLESFMNDMDGFYVKSLNSHFLIGGDDTGCLHFIEFGESWHVCNEDLPCHHAKHKEFYWDNIVKKRKNVVSDVKKINQDFKAGRGNQKKWLWRELDNRSFFKAENHHHIKNVQFSKLQLHKRNVSKVQYLPDLNLVITCSSDNTIMVINFDLLLGLKKEKSQPVSLETLLEFTHVDPSISNENKVRKFTDHKKGVKTFVWSPKFRLVASGGDERHIILWDIFTCTRISFLHGHTSGIQELALNEERNHLISLGTDKLVIIWDLRSCSILKTIPDKLEYHPEDMLTSLIFDSSAERLVFTSRRMNFWPFRTKYESTGTSHNDEVIFCIFNSAFDFVISIDASNNITSWDVKEGNMVFRFAPENIAKITAATLDDTERRFIIGDAEGKVQIYNFNNGQLLQTVETNKNVEITSVIHISGFGNSEQTQIIAGGWEKKIYFWKESADEIKIDKVIPKSSLYEFHKADITCISVSEKHKVVISGDTEGMLVYWDDKTSLSKKLPNYLPSILSAGELDKAVIKVMILEEKNIFITFSSGQIIRVWSLSTFHILFEKHAYHYEKEVLNYAAVCKDNTHLVTVDTGGYFKLWDISELSEETPKRENFRELVFIKAHSKGITYADFILYDEHRLLVTASSDKNLNLYTLKGGLIGIFGRMPWDLALPSSLTKFEPKRAPPEVRKEIQENPRKTTASTISRLPEIENKKSRPLMKNTSTDKELSTVSFERVESSVKRATDNKLSSRHSGSRQRKGSRLSYTTINEDSFDMDDIDQKTLNFDTSGGTLDIIKGSSSVLAKRTKTYTILERTNWREKVENSLMEASQFLKEETWETRDSQVESVLKRYATPLKNRPVVAKQSFSYKTCAAKLLNSDKHIPLKAPVKFGQLVKFMAEEKSPRNKFNVEFFQKGFIFYDYNHKERSRSTNAKFEHRRR